MWSTVTGGHKGRDFASYYYAGRASLEGANPWDPRALGAIARQDETRRSVHPFLYPPPFVLLVAPFTALPLEEAFTQWAVLNEICAVLTVLMLSLWWRRLHWSAPVVLFALLAALTAAPNNLAMGQVNFVVLALAVAALWLDEREHELASGVLMGLACMAKMSPALFVLWWMLRWRWKAVASACGTAMVLSLATLPLVGAADQLGFYTDVLPQFASGRYNGLSIPIGLFGNHSVPDVLHRAFPGGPHELSSTTRWLARALTVGLLCACAWRWRGGGVWQASAIAVLMLLLPVYTYEHHLVWALPACGLAWIGLFSRRLHPAWAPLVFFATVALCWDLQHLKRLSRHYPTRELKFAALLVLFAVTALHSDRSEPSS